MMIFQSSSNLFSEFDTIYLVIETFSSLLVKGTFSKVSYNLNCFFPISFFCSSSSSFRLLYVNVRRILSFVTFPTWLHLSLRLPFLLRANSSLIHTRFPKIWAISSITDDPWHSHTQCVSNLINYCIPSNFHFSDNCIVVTELTSKLVIIFYSLQAIPLSTKECCSPHGSTRIESLATAVADLHTVKGVQGRDQEWGTLCSGKTGRADFQIVRYFQEKILWFQFLASFHT